MALALSQLNPIHKKETKFVFVFFLIKASESSKSYCSEPLRELRILNVYPTHFLQMLTFFKVLENWNNKAYWYERLSTFGHKLSQRPSPGRLINPFLPVVFFYTPWKHQKTYILWKHQITSGFRDFRRRSSRIRKKRECSNMDEKVKWGW